MRHLLLAITFLTLVACGNTPPKPTSTEPAELPAAQDQIEFTRNVDPSTTKENQLDTPMTVVEQRKEPAPEKQSNPAPPPPPPAPAAAPATASEEITPPASPQPTEAAPTPPDHTPWNRLLQDHVANNGDVDYDAFKTNEAQLDEYLAALKNAPPGNDWPRDERLAYWINAYNAFTVKRILNDYPLTSITDLDGGDPWKIEWIEIGGQTYSLNNIEHDIIRPQFNEPRIHFAVNCAAASCPPLPNKAFTADNLESMLESNTRAFIRNPTYNLTSGDVKVSKIFDWYGEDFGNLKNYLNDYLATPIPEDQEIGFKEYDWALNKQ